MSASAHPPSTGHTPLPSQIRLLLGLASLCATNELVQSKSRYVQRWYQQAGSTWLQSVCKLLELDRESLPPSINAEAVRQSADDQRTEWTDDQISRVAGILGEASLPQGAEKKKKEEALEYTPLSRALSYRALGILGLEAKMLLPAAEKQLAVTLYEALRAASGDTKDKVEKSRQAQAEGWGGSLGRKLATGAGVIAGGVLIGVTGGLAAPAIAAVLAPLGISGLIGGAAAPVVLGTLFGVGGGGLAGRRVRERWKGVEEFSFIEVGAGTKATQEEVDELKAAKERYKARDKSTTKKPEEEGGAGTLAADQKVPEGATGVIEDKVEKLDISHGGQQTEEEQKKAAQEALAAAPEDDDDKVDEAAVAQQVEEDRLDLERRLVELSAGSEDTGRRGSVDAGRQSLEHGKEEKEVDQLKKPPSLTATIVVPGLLTVSKTEALTAWRAICSANTTSGGLVAPIFDAEKGEGAGLDSKKDVAGQQQQRLGLKDGRDVYLLRFESEAMLKTGRDINAFVFSKIKGKIKGEIIKRTFMKAYFAAVALPLTVYTMASMTLDNTWMHAQDRASKAGRLLGEVLEKRVQGERPVVLVGSSLGALTVLKALLYLDSLPAPAGSASAVPHYVESAYLISLPSAPTADEWQSCRRVVARRLVNAWSDADFVLAGVVRLHEVVSRAATLSNGIKVAGLGPVEQPGVQDVDVSSVLRGHMELQTKMGEVLRVIDIDA